MNRHVDVAIIGAGTAGLRATRAALEHTASVVLIEGGPGGTTCARVGCMPSKLLIAAAEAAHQAHNAGPFGINTTVSVDGSAVMERVHRERDRFTGFVFESMDSLPQDVVIPGHATFVDDHTLRVGRQTIVADRIVIATGSRSRVLPFLEHIGDRLIVNDDLFSWHDLPESVAVFGPGVIGLELGQALHRLGVRVHLFGIGGFVGPLSDPILMEEARQIFRSEFPLHSDADVQSVRLDGDRVAVHFHVDGAEVTEHFDYALAATGRIPNTDRLGLDNTSLPRTERGGLPVAPPTLRVGDTHVFVAGDANPDRPLLHEASDEGRIAGHNAGAYPDVQPEQRRSKLAIVFCDPQIALIGERWVDLQDEDIVRGRVSFVDQGRSRVRRVNRGALHVYVDCKTGVLRGAEMVGPRAEHIAHLLAWAHQQQLTVEQMLDMPFYHPVIEEGVRTALRDAASARSQRMCA